MIEKISGIYRIFIEYKDKEFSYIGISTNILSRWKHHKSNINSWYCLTQKQWFLETLKDKSIPSTDAFYWKTTFFLYQNNLEPKDFQYEILYKQKVDLGEKIELKETKLINQYNSVYQGFNGAFAKLNKLKFSVINENIYEISKVDMEVVEKQEKAEKEKNLIELINISKNTELIKSYTPWSVWQLFCCQAYEFSPKEQQIIENKSKIINEEWEKQCDEVYKIALKRKTPMLSISGRKQSLLKKNKKVEQKEQYEKKVNKVNKKVEDIIENFIEQDKDYIKTEKNIDYQRYEKDLNYKEQITKTMTKYRERIIRTKWDDIFTEIKKLDKDSFFLWIFNAEKKHNKKNK